MNFCKKIAMLLAAIILITCFATFSASAVEPVDMGAPLAEYFQNIMIDYTYDTQGDFDKTGKGKKSEVDASLIKYGYVAEDEAGSLGSAHITLGSVATEKAQHYLNYAPGSKVSNAVVEFDMAFVSIPKGGHMKLMFTGPTASGSDRTWGETLRITSSKDGKLSMTGASSLTWPVGQWKSFCILINTVDNTFTLMVKDKSSTADYTTVGTYALMDKPNGTKIDFTSCLGELRFDSYWYGGTVAYDNIAIYEGTERRDFRQINNASPSVDKFKFMAPYLNSNDKADQNYAYRNMETILPKLTDAEIAADPELQAAVDAWNAFDYDSIEDSVKAENQRVLDGYVADLNSVVRKFSNISDREAKVIVVEQYMGKNLFDTTSDGYQKAQQAVSDAKAAIASDYVIKDFIEIMRRFGRTEVLETMQGYYDQATVLVDEGLDIAVLNNNEIKGFYTEFYDAYTTYKAAVAKIQTAVNEKNSERFVAHMSHLSGYNGYNKVETWEANYDEFQMYMTYSRDMLASNEYNSNYIGFAEAMVIYNTLDDYFYGRHQEEHAIEISAFLTEYIKTDSYVTKFGICHAVNRYVEENDVDKEHEVIIPLLRQLSVYESELEILEEAYLGEIASNTMYFVGYSKQMEANRGYSALKQIYDKAIVYYHNINADTDEAVRALDIFDSCGKYLESVENDSAEFIAAAAGIGQKTGDELYLALAKCYSKASNVSEDIAGVSAALEAYEAAFAAYSASTKTINAEIGECGTVGCAVQLSQAARSAIKVIHKIF